MTPIINCERAGAAAAQNAPVVWFHLEREIGFHREEPEKKAGRSLGFRTGDTHLPTERSHIALCSVTEWLFYLGWLQTGMGDREWRFPMGGGQGLVGSHFC